MGSRTARAVTALSALAFGVLGWCGAHTLTWWLLLHEHVVDGATVTHQDSHLPAVMVLAAAVALASLLAMLVTSRGTHPRAPATRRELRWAAALSGLAVVGADGAEGLLTGSHGLPAEAMLVTAVVYAFTAAITALAWRKTTVAVHRLAQRAQALGTAEAVSLPTRSRVVSQVAGLRHRSVAPRWVRGPPALSA